MKKLLSILLAAALLCGAFALGASAEEETPPAVTAMEADWDGTYSFWLYNTVQFLPKLGSMQLMPEFGPENVQITLHYDDGTQEDINRWLKYSYDNNGRMTGFAWTIRTVRTGADEWTFYCAENDRTPNDTMPHASITVPSNYLEQMKALAVPLALDKNTAVAPETLGENFFSFTPAESGTYTFGSQSSGEYPTAMLTDANLKFIKENEKGGAGNDFSLIVRLNAGETYYLCVGRYWNFTSEVTITVTKGWFDAAMVWLWDTIKNVAFYTWAFGPLVVTMLMPLFWPVLVPWLIVRVYMLLILDAIFS